MSAGIRYGTRSALPSIFGLQAGLAISVVLVGLGIGSLIASSLFFFTLLKIIGSLYLIYLGIQKWRASDSSMPFPGTTYTARPFRFTRALVINLSNPKAIAFLVALFPQFIDPSRPQALQFLILGSTMVVVDTLDMIVYACLASRCVQWFRQQSVSSSLSNVFLARPLSPPVSCWRPRPGTAVNKASGLLPCLLDNPLDLQAKLFGGEGFGQVAVNAHFLG
ncbi:hypothetical protein GF1_17380 [Desulfolithobacter dissulfuricans]|uniref:Homoserine/homoserine lactone efflux protein n=1 Tax=Desulfolithobacter dissulfuricans TaxID=2795293 RepID=A0A915U2K9_9BACT|nr:LysE family transporter [Desulfolithobacter dissulfuricans]BCO09362.1 hypothetical protein GF1_17380 [Desulfolithobacter dissulfuricans]